MVGTLHIIERTSFGGSATLGDTLLMGVAIGAGTLNNIEIQTPCRPNRHPQGIFKTLIPHLQESIAHISS